MNINEFPAIPLTIVEALEEVFPPRDFDTSTSSRDLDFHFGQRSVVTFLRSKFEQQSENILKPN
tara:strand:+ start:1071 stop:1262 length:192 start_codon:yes stop_codon:yes gene_type:complete